MNKAKGIHKPKGWRHALSVRQTIGGPYSDRERVWREDGSWQFDYYQEGADPDLRDTDFTNRALMQNIKDAVPVAVLKQVRPKPNPRYEVVGVAAVIGWEAGYFKLEGYTPEGLLFSSGAQAATGPTSLEDARKRIDAAIVMRQGSGAFRQAVLDAFGWRCALTGCDAEAALEAAHIVPYLGQHTDVVSNALLLRSDIHTLFDRDLIRVDLDTMAVRLAPALQSTRYASLEGKRLRLPAGDQRGWLESLRSRAEILGLA
jgi:hypothetical protein